MPIEPIEALAAAARAASPEVARAEAQLKIAQGGVRVARSEFLPDLDLVARLRRDENLDFDNSIREEGAALAQVSMPVFVGGNRSRWRQARLQVQEAQSNLLAAKADAAERVAIAYAEYEAAAPRLAASRVRAEAAALAVENGVRERNLGERTTIELLVLQQDLVAARIAAARDAQFAGFQALAAAGILSLERAIGEELRSDLLFEATEDLAESALGPSAKRNSGLYIQAGAGAALLDPRASVSGTVIGLEAAGATPAQAAQAEAAFQAALAGGAAGNDDALGPAISGAVGWRLAAGPRLEAEIVRLAADGGSDAFGRTSGLLGFMNVLYEAPWDGVRPYAGGGVGVGRSRLRPTGGGDLSDVGFAWQARGGIVAPIGPATAVEFGYRYVRAPAIEASAETDLSGDLNAAFGFNPPLEPGVVIGRAAFAARPAAHALTLSVRHTLAP